MLRFLLGLGLGSLASYLTYVLTTDGALTAVVGLGVAVLVWFGAFILDELL
ncbi:hypothetical protein [Streptomyces sp. CC224B]|uniref:hypothetical protein n=1 Tax=Streptomyces sp. CC224B TaxID=3044571 RepID=UPI0024A99569|nr:hypothetical protein [Streptomyces sp. CC224B]